MSSPKKALIVLVVIAGLFALTWMPHGGKSGQSASDSTSYMNGNKRGGVLATFGRLTDRGTTLDSARIKGSCRTGDTLVVLSSPATPRCTLIILPTSSKAYQFLELKLVKGRAATISSDASGTSGGGTKSIAPDSSTKLPVATGAGSVTITCVDTAPCVLAVVRST